MWVMLIYFLWLPSLVAGHRTAYNLAKNVFLWDLNVSVLTVDNKTKKTALFICSKQRITSLSVTESCVFDAVPWIMQWCWPPPQCDAVSVLEKEHDYREEHFDFIQSHVRRFSLQCILWIVPRPNSFGWNQQSSVVSHKRVRHRLSCRRLDFNLQTALASSIPQWKRRRTWICFTNTSYTRCTTFSSPRQP